MALNLSRTKVNKNEVVCEEDELEEQIRERKLELLGMAFLVTLIIYLLSIQSSLGNVGLAIRFLTYSAVGKIGAYVIPIGLVLLSVSFLLARRIKPVDGLWKFFFIAAPITSAVVDILMHTKLIYLEGRALREVGYVGLYLSKGFRAAFGTVGSIWIIAAMMLIIFFATTGFSINGAARWLRLAFGKYREKAKIKALSKAVATAATSEVCDDGPEIAREIIEPIVADEPKEQMNLGFDKKKEKADTDVDLEQTSAPKPKRRRRKYKLPPLNLMTPSPKQSSDAEEQREAAETIVNTLETYNVQAEVLDIIRGPRVTRVEVGIGEGTRLYKIEALADEIAYNLPAKSVRIEAPIPGKRAVGIEFPNRRPVVVNLREMFASERFKKHPSLLYMAIAKDLGGDPVYADLSTMPHLLIAGQTGSGKSVCLNACILSLLYRATPEDVKLILIDPKLVEMASFEGLPHLLTEVVNDINDALNALRWAVEEMRDRYKRLKKAGVTNIAGYNDALADGEARLPYIVIVVDEMADLMGTEPVEMERLIAALTRLARAVGIHLVLATQRPDVKVITGGIKANIPARIAFALPSQHDSKTVLNTKGAEKLLGNGDLLFQAVGESKPIRAQGALVTREEINSVVKFWVDQGEPEFDDEILRDRAPDKSKAPTAAGREMTDDDKHFVEQAIKIIWVEGEASVSMLQRKLGIGYPKAGRIMEYLDQMGLVGPKAGSKPRRIIFDENHPALKLFCEDTDELLDMNVGKEFEEKDGTDEFDEDLIPPHADAVDGGITTSERGGI